MSLSICSECLSRLRISTTPRRTLPIAAATWMQTTSFHTTAAQYKSPLLKKKATQQGSSAPRARQSQSARLKKKSRERPKLPPVGERRAQRRRIVLSNTNAIPVSNMETWSKDNVAEEKHIGQMMALDGGLLDQLRDSRAFKTTQNWCLFRRPATLIRQETIKVAKDMQDIESADGANRFVKRLVVGERASGKSILMLQAMSMAYMKQWIVLNIPEAQEHVNNTSSYAPLRHAETDTEQMYTQPHLTQLLLQRAVASNESVLKTLKLNHSHAKPLSLKSNATLYDLAQQGAADFHVSSPAWQALYKELSVPGVNPRPPVLVAADGVDHWMGPTLYRNSEHKIIHAHQFTLVKRFTNFLFSSPGTASPFVNGGMVLFSTSGSNTPAHPTFELLLSQMRAVQYQHMAPTDPDFPLPKPYSKPDEHVLALSGAATAHNNVHLMELKGLGREESRGYLEYFARSGILHQKITDGFVGEMRGLSGGGVVGELARLGRRAIA
ncbi:putative mitochondrial ribosomal protein DAP3 [Cladophialophora carrionii]|uniref:Small ribosomal subunit protein mS29 n=1 Tax=Cladophialophora carrionii TaxID=86049 RepID=A0A1C1CBW6_9EURO|nr:putative mitochondrial ribosomal protein DAP3 [Cladophialophora carrionii]